LQTYNPCPGVMDNVPSARGYQVASPTNLMLKGFAAGGSAGDDR